MISIWLVLKLFYQSLSCKYHAGVTQKYWHLLQMGNTTFPALVCHCSNGPRNIQSR